MEEEKNIHEENSNEEVVKENISQQGSIEHTEANRTSDITTSEIKDMEVHHHPHVEKKNFKEYFLEFLMIFLAVTLGFFAENIREHLSENNRAHDLAEALDNDLKKDTAQLNFLINFNQGKLSVLDSLFDISFQPFDQINQQDFYRFIQRAVHTKMFSPNNASAEEIKRAGYFHYYKTDSLADLISQYDFLKTDFTNESQLEIKIDQDEWTDIASEVTDPGSLHKAFRPYHPVPVPFKIGIAPVPVEKMNRFKGHITKMRAYVEYDVDVFLRMKVKATEIMDCMKRNKIITE